MSDLFKLSEYGQRLAEEMSAALTKLAENYFLPFLQTEGCPRKAGSVTARICIDIAAKMAVFGARAVEAPPNAELWMQFCREAFDREVKAQGAALSAIAEQKTFEGAHDGI